MCMPFRLMDRIWPFGRMLAVPPPLSDTCLPGGVRPVVLAMFPVPPLPEPPVFPTEPAPFLPEFRVPGLAVEVLPDPLPDLPWVVPGRPLVEWAWVEGWLVEDFAGALLCGALGLGGAGGVFFCCAAANAPNAINSESTKAELKRVFSLLRIKLMCETPDGQIPVEWFLTE